VGTARGNKNFSRKSVFIFSWKRNIFEWERTVLKWGQPFANEVRVVGWLCVILAQESNSAAGNLIINVFSNMARNKNRMLFLIFCFAIPAARPKSIPARENLKRHHCS